MREDRNIEKTLVKIGEPSVHHGEVKVLFPAYQGQGMHSPGVHLLPHGEPNTLHRFAQDNTSYGETIKKHRQVEAERRKTKIIQDQSRSSAKECKKYSNYPPRALSAWVVHHFQ